ncbi:hypothetical protein [Halosegnis marinus]|uniref:Uncharacterized protein n=1 Tax=Halosegnis marinus TaxID=3034023 RepID=A0ABD5ZMS2_9EURY|nr:hypothetical protein [Halosegnis sp. DT85]
MVSIPAEWTDEIAPSTLMVAGFLLFVFPEPATSALGAGLMLYGAAWWFYEWGRP